MEAERDGARFSAGMKYDERVVRDLCQVQAARVSDALVPRSTFLVSVPPRLGIPRFRSRALPRARPLCAPNLDYGSPPIFERRNVLPFDVTMSRCLRRLIDNSSISKLLYLPNNGTMEIWFDLERRNNRI